MEREERRDKSIKIDYLSCAIFPLPEMGIKRPKQMSKFILLFREIDYDRRHFCTTTINNDINHCKHVNQVNRLKLPFWFLPMLKSLICRTFKGAQWNQSVQRQSGNLPRWPLEAHMQQRLGQRTSSRGVPGDELWFPCRSTHLSHSGS